MDIFFKCRWNPALADAFLCSFGCRIWQRQPLPAVSIHAASTRGTRIVAGPARSLRFPTLRLPASATGGGRLRSHRARVDGNLSKYNVRTYLKMGQEKQFPEGKEISPATRLSLFLWNPATSYSPGRFLPRCIRHRRRASGNLVKYGVRTHLEMIREENSLALHKRKHPTFVGCFSLWNPATSYSPGPSPGKYHRR